MSYIGFISRAFAISPYVFLRFLPIVAIFIFLVVGLFASTDNIYVIGLLGFLLATFGQTFLYITAIRGALQTVKATDPPTFDAMLGVTVRMMFSLMLVMLLLVLLLTSLFYLGYTTAFLSGQSAVAARALGGLMAGVLTLDGDQMTSAVYTLNALEEEPGAVRAAITAMSLSYQFAVGLVISVFGIPLAAFSANAVHKSPGNDLIFGIFRYFPHQITIFVLATILPSYFLMQLTPTSDLIGGPSASQGYSVIMIVLMVWSLYAPCVSYAGMAIGYTLIKKKVWHQLQQERVPDIDYDAERENVRNLRAMRRNTTGDTTVYDPNAALRDVRRSGGHARAMPEDPDDEYEDEVRTSLRAMRQSRRGETGAKMYDPLNPDGDD